MDMGKEATEGVVPALNSKYENIEYVEADAAFDKRLVRKIDFHVIPILIILFTFSLIDRNIIATARVAGMGNALDLTGNRYSVALLVLFPLYILIELPTTFVLRKISVKAFFFGMVFCWGIVAMCHAFVKTFPQLVAVRILLGLFEGSFQVSVFSNMLFPSKLSPKYYSRFASTSSHPGTPDTKHKDASLSGSPWDNCSQLLPAFFPTA
jgi:hypothetical protein